MGVTVTMSMDQWAAWMSRLQGRFMPAAIRGIRTGAVQAHTVMLKRTKKAPPASDRPGSTPGAFNYGTYFESWKISPLPDGAVVYNSQPYAGVIEYGRRPSPVSKEGRRNLTRWAMRKLGVTESEAKSVAFLVARSLKKRPLRARNVMTGGVQEMTDAVRGEITKELDVELSRKP